MSDNAQQSTTPSISKRSSLPPPTAELVEKTRAQLIEYERQLAAEQRNKILSLPEKLGYKNINALIMALIPYSKGLAVRNVAKRSGASKARGKGRKRSKLTDDIRKSIVSDLKAGELTGAAIAKKYGISLPTVANIKKGAGLTKARK